jgi:hypothetical protein
VLLLVGRGQEQNVGRFEVVVDDVVSVTVAHTGEDLPENLASQGLAQRPVGRDVGSEIATGGEFEHEDDAVGRVYLAEELGAPWGA